MEHINFIFISIPITNQAPPLPLSTIDIWHNVQPLTQSHINSITITTCIINANIQELVAFFFFLNLRISRINILSLRRIILYNYITYSSFQKWKFEVKNGVGNI